MKLFITIFFIGISQLVSGQIPKLSDEQINKSKVGRITFADTIRNCELIDDWFKSDIKNNTIFIFLQGGIAPAVYENDTLFENKYKIYFYDFGDLTSNMKCIVRYNENVFNYLTNLHGNKWMKEIRKDVIGLNTWKKRKSK